MPRRYPKPFWRSSRNCWFVQLGKEQVKLPSDEGEALKLYHGLMADRARWMVTPAPAAPGLAAAELFDKYLDWC